MKNKLKIAAIVVVVIAGMVAYKTFFDKRQEKENKSPNRKNEENWN